MLCLMMPGELGWGQEILADLNRVDLVAEVDHHVGSSHRCLFLEGYNNTYKNRTNTHTSY